MWTDTHTDRHTHTDRQTYETTTVTLAAHVRRGLTRVVSTWSSVIVTSTAQCSLHHAATLFPKVAHMRDNNLGVCSNLLLTLTLLKQSVECARNVDGYNLAYIWFNV